MPVVRTAAILLRRIPFGETSWIVHALTESEGAMGMLARGARRQGSPLTSGVETLTLSELVVSVKPGRELQNLMHASALESHANLSLDLERQTTAQACAEAVLRFLREGGAAPGIFHLLRDTLTALDAQSDCAPALWRFLSGFADELGWGLAIDHCAQCGSEEVASSRSISTEAGGFLCPSCARRSHGSPVSPVVAELLRSTSHPEDVRPTYEPGDAEAIEDILYGHLCRHAGIHPRLETRTLLKMARQP